MQLSLSPLSLTNHKQEDIEDNLDKYIESIVNDGIDLDVFFKALENCNKDIDHKIKENEGISNKHPEKKRDEIR
tara:strand:+ start:301 stop:522 length:222 start_codon:yes stop_codon:yes gene_type:complete